MAKVANVEQAIKWLRDSVILTLECVDTLEVKGEDIFDGVESMKILESLSDVRGDIGVVMTWIEEHIKE